jgi:hypothetical protein
VIRGNHLVAREAEAAMAARQAREAAELYWISRRATSEFVTVTHAQTKSFNKHWLRTTEQRVLVEEAHANKDWHGLVTVFPQGRSTASDIVTRCPPVSASTSCGTAPRISRCAASKWRLSVHGILVDALQHDYFGARLNEQIYSALNELGRVIAEPAAAKAALLGCSVLLPLASRDPQGHSIQIHHIFNSQQSLPAEQKRRARRVAFAEALVEAAVLENRERTAREQKQRVAAFSAAPYAATSTTAAFVSPQRRAARSRCQNADGYSHKDWSSLSGK